MTEVSTPTQNDAPPQEDDRPFDTNEDTSPCSSSRPSFLANDDNRTADIPPTADVCSILIQAHLVVEDTVSTTTLSNDSLTTTDEDEDEERGNVVVVDAKPLTELVISQKTRRICISLLVVAVLLILGCAVSALTSAGRNSSSGRGGFRHKTSNNDNQNPMEVATPSANGEESEEESSAASFDQEEMNLYTSRFRDHFWSIIPEFSRIAVANESSPQHSSFHYLTGLLTTFPALPEDTAVLDLFGINMFHITSNGAKWYGYCSAIPVQKTRSFDICMISVVTCPSPIRETFVTLDVRGMGVEGYLAPEFGLMTNLRSIDLSHNTVGQRLPRELGLLRQLEHLDTSFNQFEGPFPTTLLEPSQPLATVQLNNNAFSGPLVPEWANLNKTLETLHLHSNQFHGTIPDSWSALSKLKLLTLHDNPGLSGSVPAGLCKMVNSGTLNLTLDCNAVSCGTCGCHCVNGDGHGRHR